MNIISCNNDINSIFEYIKHKPLDEIIIELSNIIKKTNTNELHNWIIGGYSEEITSSSYYFVIKELKENIYKYEWLYHRLEDKGSKELLLNLIRYRLTTDIKFINQSSDNHLIKCNKDNDFVEYEDINEIKVDKDFINNYSHKLKIYLYNEVSDLWEIPELIDSINDNYKFYLRYYKNNISLETVLYAVPNLNNTNTDDYKKGFYLIPYTENYITNVRLTKDVGLIPYFMYRYKEYNAVLVSEKDEHRKYLDKYVNGLKISLTNPELSFKEGILNYIAKNYRKMDKLMLFGIYDTYLDKLKFYKMLRPNGKVYLKLDANSGWMDSIDFNKVEIIEFLNSIDVISVESKLMKQYLSRKIPYKKIEYIPNGYFDYVNYGYVEYEQKDNIILTVGRIGTKQKNNEILLEAFKLVSDQIPEWKLKLIGNIDSNFIKYIENYFNENPNLRERVIFTGNIESKEELFKQYRSSKIFVLSSTFEGGAPNVYSEAALNGNYIITSKIDSYMEMTDNLKYGDVFDIGDTIGLASILLKRCKNEYYISQKCRGIQKYVRTYYDYQKIVNKIDYLLNM